MNVLIYNIIFYFVTGIILKALHMDPQRISMIVALTLIFKFIYKAAKKKFLTAFLTYAVLLLCTIGAARLGVLFITWMVSLV